MLKEAVAGNRFGDEEIGNGCVSDDHIQGEDIEEVNREIKAKNVRPRWE